MVIEIDYMSLNIGILIGTAIANTIFIILHYLRKRAAIRAMKKHLKDVSE